MEAFKAERAAKAKARAEGTCPWWCARKSPSRGEEVNITPVFDLCHGRLLSFISLTLVLPALVPPVAPQGDLVMLVKPQFELQPGQVGRGGIVRDASAVPRGGTAHPPCCAALGLEVRAWIDSPIQGGDGNREFLYTQGGPHERSPRARHRFPVSFWIFPPKRLKAPTSCVARQQLYALHPDFCSVTYGAGAPRKKARSARCRRILSEGVGAASHFRAALVPRASRCASSLHAQAMGVRRLVALRGDLPSGYGAGGEFQYASDLVAFIRAPKRAGTSTLRWPPPPRGASPGQVARGGPAGLRDQRCGRGGLCHHPVFLTTAMRISALWRRTAWALTPVVPGIMPISSSRS